METQLVQVLLVEDNPGDALLLQEVLAGVGVAEFRLAHVERLSEALKRLGEEHFDVVLLDLLLPDSQGLETLVRVQERAHEVPIIVLTATDDEALAIKAVQAGAQDYLVKGQADGYLLVRAMRYAIERKRTEEEKAHIEAQLRQAQKMDAVGRLAGGVAHDFNNLLTVITGHASLLLGRLASHDPLRVDIEEMKKATERAASLTGQLLAFSRRQVVKPRVLDLNDVVVEMERMLRRTIGEDIDLVTPLSVDLGSAKADPGQIEQVLVNLAVNARDAMPEGGRLTIETANVDLDEGYASLHVGVEPGSYVMLIVSDTGCGMDAETQSHLFEPFFTTKERDRGTGLGLPTVYGIVKQSGGHIWLYSELGIGTTFKIYLPRFERGARVPVRNPTPAETPRRPKTLLLVEDEEAARKLLGSILRMVDYTVLEARSGSEALMIGEQHKDPIDLMVTDVVLPQMNGPEVARKLAPLFPGMKVLYMSGYTENTTVDQGMLEEGAAFLEKPFTPEAMVRKVRELLDASPQAAH